MEWSGNQPAGAPVSNPPEYLAACSGLGALSSPEISGGPAFLELSEHEVLVSAASTTNPEANLFRFKILVEMN